MKLPCSPAYAATGALVRDMELHTVCRSARCPNIFECYSRKTATFLIPGDTCTRGCAFCNIGNGAVREPDPDEPARVGRATAALGLRHAVVTSVTRDDLPTAARRISRPPSRPSAGATDPVPPSRS